MRPFDALSHRGRLPRLRGLAAAALAQYDLPPSRLRVLAHRANTIFAVTPEPGPAGPGAANAPLILRIYGPHSPPPEMVASELAWLAALGQETDLPVPVPVPTRAGALLGHATAAGLPAPRQCVLFQAVPGRFVDAGLRPAHLARVGTLMAQLHTHAAEFSPPPGFVRPRWNWRGVFGASSVFAPGRGGDLLSAGDRAIFTAAADRIELAMENRRPDPAGYGLIHADLQQTNYLFDRGTAGAIDFADCCWGDHLYDMTITLFEVGDRPGGPALRAAFFDGYRRIRPLPDDYEAGIRLFTAIRLAKRVNYLANAPDPAVRARAPGWVAYAARWLAEFTAR
ncbi:MAG TPA: phosphotransferase [Chloroflexia bacterium]|nr:phosphotransferase [Chloroflexia bacterium]